MLLNLFLICCTFIQTCSFVTEQFCAQQKLKLGCLYRRTSAASSIIKIRGILSHGNVILVERMFTMNVNAAHFRPLDKCQKSAKMLYYLTNVQNKTKNDETMQS